MAWPAIRAVLFDFDGTLTAPGSLDFEEIRRALGCPPGEPVLEFIAALPEPGEQARALEILHRFEEEGARRAQPNRGAEELVAYLRGKQLPVGILSRNRRASVLRALQNFSSLQPGDFQVILSRDDDLPPKPSPEGIYRAAREMGVSVQELLAVGDFHFDVEAGEEAGAVTVFLTNGQPRPRFLREPRFVIDRLEELKPLVERLAVLPLGKLPNALLGPLLEGLTCGDPSVVVGPGVGEDAAVVRSEPGCLLVLKSDPITFPAERPGYSAVVVNANDLATSGAVPRWLLSTFLFPPGSCAAQVEEQVRELEQAARALGVTLCGGHTEITDAVHRPVVVAQLAGTVSARGLIRKDRMKEGDWILLTKALAVEGTALLAHELGPRLRQRGMAEEELEQSRRLLHDPGISVVEEARIAAAIRGVTALHDVTEGGLATALEELSAAGGHRLEVEQAQIPVLPQTRSICELLGLDPRGLIGSGSLLITCRPGAGPKVLKRLQKQGVRVSRIGRVLGTGRGVEEAGKSPWPRFDRDEIARALESA